MEKTLEQGLQFNFFLNSILLFSYLGLLRRKSATIRTS